MVKTLKPRLSMNGSRPWRDSPKSATDRNIMFVSTGLDIFTLRDFSLSWRRVVAVCWSRRDGPRFLIPHRAMLARYPDCRQPPPKTLRIRLARAIKSFGPRRIDPTGQERALEKQIVSVVAGDVQGRRDGNEESCWCCGCVLVFNCSILTPEDTKFHIRA